MELSETEKGGLDTVLHEATLLGVEVVPARRLVGATFAVFALSEDGRPPEDARIQFRFQPVGRVAASLIKGHWTDPHPELIPIRIAELLGIVESFKEAVYGGDLFDAPLEREDYRWLHRLSLDWEAGEEGRSHHIHLFQEGGDRHLDMCIWFDAFTICDVNGREVNMDSLISDSRRFWDAFYRDDPKAAEEAGGRGLFRLSP